MEAEIVRHIPSAEVLTLREKAEAIVIHSREDYLEATPLIVTGRALIKKRKAEDEPGITSAKEHWELLKSERDRKVAEVQMIVDALVKKCEAWTAEERRQAQLETDRLNAAAREKQRLQAEADKLEADRQARADRIKRVSDIRQQLLRKQITKRQAERMLRDAGAIEEAEKAAAAAAEEEAKTAPAPVVRVEPNVPKAAGIRRRMNYYAELSPQGGQGDFMREFVRAVAGNDLLRIAFLGRFLEISNQKIAEYARETRNSEQVMREIPGVRAWDKPAL